MRQDTGGAPPRCYVAREGRWQVIGPLARLSSLAEERLGGGLRLAPRASADIQASRLTTRSPTLLTVSRDAAACPQIAGLRCCSHGGARVGSDSWRRNPTRTGLGGGSVGGLGAQYLY